MEFFVVLFFLVVAFQVVRAAAAQQGQGKQLPPAPPPPSATAAAGEEEVIRIGPLTIRLPPEARQALAPPPPQAPADPWWEEEEEKGAPLVSEPAYGAAPVEVAVYHPPPPMSVEARPLPPAPLALDGEVDRDAEHARLHARIDRPRSPAATVRARRAPAREPLGDLRDPAALRRAVIAAEVLGPPRALRPPGD